MKKNANGCKDSHLSHVPRNDKENEKAHQQNVKYSKLKLDLKSIYATVGAVEQRLYLEGKIQNQIINTIADALHEII